MDCHTVLVIISTFGALFLGVLNTITCILGAGLIYIGVRLKEAAEKHEDILEFMDKVDFGDITLREIAELLIKIVIIVGVFAIVTSVIGGCGALCRLRVCLLVYVGILIMCIVLELTILGYWIRFLQGIHEFLFGQFNKLLKLYQGPTELHLISAGWNAVFIFFTCCGVKPVTTSYNDFQALPSEWWSNATRGNDVIPSSCCEDVSIDNYLDYSNPRCTQSLIGYHSAGCYDVFEDIFNTLASAAITVTTVIVLVEIAAIVFSVIIVYTENDRSRTHVV